jgi:hypothetical protein
VSTTEQKFFKFHRLVSQTAMSRTIDGLNGQTSSLNLFDMVRTAVVIIL